MPSMLISKTCLISLLSPKSLPARAGNVPPSRAKLRATAEMLFFTECLLRMAGLRGMHEKHPSQGRVEAQCYRTAKIACPPGEFNVKEYLLSGIRPKGRSRRVEVNSSRWRPPPVGPRGSC